MQRAAGGWRRVPVLCLTALVWACHSPGPAGDNPVPKPPQPAPRDPVVRPAAGIVVRPRRHEIRIDATACLDAGWLEVVACAPGTKEHESLLVVESRPSDVHAALLLAGFRPGSPGQWRWQDETLSLTPPTGDPLSVSVRYELDGRTVEEPVSLWITAGDDGDHRTFPDNAWVFGGSRFAENPPSMGPGEHYVADMSGLIVGLATFGSEVICFREVLSPESSVQEPVWQVDTDHVPPMGTPVELIIRPPAAE